MDESDLKFVERAYELARKSFEEGGLPIGSVLVRAGRIIGEGHNRRVQHGDAIAHGEMDCIRNAGRQRTYKDTVLYTSLSPCMMCSGTIVQFGIPRVVIGENRTFGGNESFLQGRGVAVEIADDKKCIELMQRFIREHPEIWNEDIGED
jgi:cytosine/creatinine deaminase